jgi:hypothetical protein
MSGVNNFPDGTVQPDRKLPPMLAPELRVPAFTGEDLSWVAGPGGAKGMQPITSTNPNGDYSGVSPMSPGLADIMSAPNGSVANNPAYDPGN